MDDNTVQIIQALQRRYRVQKIDGIVDVETMELIKALAEKQSAIANTAMS